MRKLRCSRGETLAEALVAILVISMTVAFLATSLVAAARINSKVKEEEYAFNYDSSPASTPGTLEVSFSGEIASFSEEVDVYETESGFVYYRK